MVVLHAEVSGFELDLEKPGRTVVLVCHGPKSQDAPKVVGKAVRAEHPDAKNVLVANVVNLKSMQGMWQKIARSQMKATYDKLAAKIGDGAEEYVVLHADWENEVAPSFGIPDSNKEPAVVVIGADGTVVGHASSDLEASALDLISKA